jgi:hypothetical protein
MIGGTASESKKEMDLRDRELRRLDELKKLELFNKK